MSWKWGRFCFKWMYKVKDRKKNCPADRTVGQIIKSCLQKAQGRGWKQQQVLNPCSYTRPEVQISPGSTENIHWSWQKSAFPTWIPSHNSKTSNFKGMTAAEQFDLGCWGWSSLSALGAVRIQGTTPTQPDRSSVYLWHCKCQKLPHLQPHWAKHTQLPPVSVRPHFNNLTLNLMRKTKLEPTHCSFWSIKIRNSHLLPQFEDWINRVVTAVINEKKKLKLLALLCPGIHSSLPKWCLF